jgi:hypothetical protein
LYTVYDGGGGNRADEGGLKMKPIHPGNAGWGWRRVDWRRDAGGIGGEEGEKKKAALGRKLWKIQGEEWRFRGRQADLRGKGA